MKRKNVKKGASQTGAPVLERKRPWRSQRETFLIYCEGKNTEPSYFNKFRISSVTIKAYGEGRNTIGLVRRAIEIRDKNPDRYDQVWCVFDMDEHGVHNFNEAIKLAKKSGLHVAYSNQAFEYWLILHFENHNGGSIPRSDYEGKLNNYLRQFGVEYNTNGSKIITEPIFDVLLGYDQDYGDTRITCAIKRAERIYNQYDHISPGKEESSTTVFQLVKELNRFL